MMLVAALFLAQAGLQVDELKPGKGAPAAEGDILTVQYRGTLANGKVFDESKPERPPFAFKLGAGQVIPGWEQGMKGMRVGGKRKLVIPPNLAYGDRGSGEIPGGSTLTFEVELLRIDAKDARPQVELKTLKKGMGLQAADGDELIVHYLGTFLNKHKFDSSYDRKEPFPVKLGTTRLIPGFVEALKGMRKGEKRRAVIPNGLAYGEKGAGEGLIPRYATLIFEIELVDLQRKPGP